jgi:hypothetical protein
MRLLSTIHRTILRRRQCLQGGEKDVLVAVDDIQSGTWKMAREIFEVLQKEITSKRKTVNEINIKVIQEVATDIGALVKYT